MQANERYFPGTKIIQCLIKYEQATLIASSVVCLDLGANRSTQIQARQGTCQAVPGQGARRRDGQGLASFQSSSETESRTLH